MKKTTLEEKLSSLEPAYQSTAERQIGRMLDQYGIPFFYRQTLLIYDQGQNQLWEPSFVLPGYEGMVIDYLSPDKNREAFDNLEHHRRVYAYNQIPAILVTAKDIQGLDWQQNLYQKVQQIYRQPVGYQTYPA